ncbi:MAG: Chemotaxis response regulator protein-glutamate methylesterase [Candidatus Magnetoglobus multicellularis str. Araruama]|uniref:protein-glutamate methylesterase n=1 Tax=Candidatus Magnetoglobus multicellularis str. Araruama TaxID=890399 RepID=A0A1V1PAV3_9BACT|nr:MAG: Chemotaxis response regulator protein-glutamate methylesterase [Candidatus Magnetoglobus multicellularis str. Araruama]
MKYKSVVIGVSAGGLEALKQILPKIPGNFPVPIIVVQHRHPFSDDSLEMAMDDLCQIKVKPINDKTALEPGMAYFAPPNYHVMIEDDMTFSLTLDPPVNFSRPSIDVLFESASDIFGKNLVGIVLTGANKDGSLGLSIIQNRGGLAIVQDPETAAVDAMPLAAIAATKVDYILKLELIADMLVQLFMDDK